MSADVVTIPVTPQPPPLEERFPSEEARQAYFAGYADGLTDRSRPDAGFLFGNESDLRAELARLRRHLRLLAS